MFSLSVSVAISDIFFLLFSKLFFFSFSSKFFCLSSNSSTLTSFIVVFLNVLAKLVFAKLIFFVEHVLLKCLFLFFGPFIYLVLLKYLEFFNNLVL